MTLHPFTDPWDTWEVHPCGEELVLCLEWSITLHQEMDGRVRKVAIEKGEGVVNSAGVWHTADAVSYTHLTATKSFCSASAGSPTLEGIGAEAPPGVSVALLPLPAQAAVATARTIGRRDTKIGWCLAYAVLTRVMLWSP